MFQDFNVHRAALPAPVSRDHPPVIATARGVHAHMLDVAAARRLRAAERGRSHRLEDASYWKAVAPAALAKARGLRCAAGFARLP
jgi:hypothetical protein